MLPTLYPFNKIISRTKSNKWILSRKKFGWSVTFFELITPTILIQTYDTNIISGTFNVSALEFVGNECKTKRVRLEVAVQV